MPGITSYTQTRDMTVGVAVIICGDVVSKCTLPGEGSIAMNDWVVIAGS